MLHIAPYFVTALDSEAASKVYPKSGLDSHACYACHACHASKSSTNSGPRGGWHLQVEHGSETAERKLSGSVYERRDEVGTDSPCLRSL